MEDLSTKYSATQNITENSATILSKLHKDRLLKSNQIFQAITASQTPELAPVEDNEGESSNDFPSTVTLERESHHDDEKWYHNTQLWKLMNIKG